MGKASSAKNVARVAKVGGKSAKQRRNLGFPLAVIGLVVVGVLAVVMVKVTRSADNEAAANQVPKLGDHIHMAYGINDCGKWLDPIPQPATDPFGIHTHGDDVIHIHPFSASAAGKNAKLSVFNQLVGLNLSKTSLSYPGVSMKDSCNGKPAVLRVGLWENAFDAAGKPTTAKPDRVYTSDFGDIALDHDRGALAFVFGPADTPITLPPSVPTLNSLSDVGPAQQGGSVPATPTVPAPTVPGGSTVPGAPDTSAPAAAPTTAPAAAPTTAPAPTDAPPSTQG